MTSRAHCFRLKEKIMIRTKIFSKVTDSSASPHITQKDVIMCRSGIQYYHKSELQGFITEDNKPPKEKEWYKEYRPANVVVRAKELCKGLPVTCEHPNEWVTPDNFKELAGGVTDNEVDVVALEGEAEGEIGLKSNITFFTRDLYDYYKDNKEVSLGYTVEKHFVDNPEEVGYDILLDVIKEVNHLAITKSGRGGSAVSVIDSIIGGMKPMRTGIWAWLKNKKQTDSKTSFGKEVFEALRSCKGSSEEEQSKELKGIFDSCAELKDCPQKNTMLDMIRDCYDNREKALANEEELVTAFDSMYVSLSGDSLKEIVDAIKGISSGTPTIGAVDSESKPKEDENNDSESKPKEDENNDSESKPKEDENNDGCHGKSKGTKDSAPVSDSAPVTRAELTQLVKDSMKDGLKDVVTSIVKDTLGIKNGANPQVEGSQIDSSNITEAPARDYSEFLN